MEWLPRRSDALAGQRRSMRPFVRRVATHTAVAPLTGEVSAGEADHAALYHVGVAVPNGEKRRKLAASLRSRSRDRRGGQVDAGRVPSDAQRRVNEGLFVPTGGVMRGFNFGAKGFLPVMGPLGHWTSVQVPRGVETLVMSQMKRPIVREVWTAANRGLRSPAWNVYVSPLVRAGMERSTDPIISDRTRSWMRDRLGLD